MVAVQTQVAPEKTQQGEDQKHPLLQSNALQPPIAILPHPQYYNYQLPCTGRIGMFAAKMVPIFQPNVILPIMLAFANADQEQVNLFSKSPLQTVFRSPFNSVYAFD